MIVDSTGQPLTRRRVSGIVLAGGRSSRFGRDKLAEPIDGRALLLHAIDAVRPLVSEVLVVVGPGARPAVPPDVRIVHDAAPFEGPLAGLLAGLGAANELIVLVTAGDMPELVAGVVEVLLTALNAPGTDVAVLGHGGQALPLPMALRRDAGMAATAGLVETGERRLRALIDALATTVIAEATWRVLDPEGRTVRDIDTPADLP